MEEERKYSEELTVKLLNTIQTDINEVKADVKQHIETEHKNVLANEERAAYVDMLIKREEKRNRVRDAIIEKTMVSLGWAFLVGIGTLIVSALKSTFVVKMLEAFLIAHGFIK